MIAAQFCRVPHCRSNPKVQCKGGHKICDGGPSQTRTTHLVPGRHHGKDGLPDGLLGPVADHHLVGGVPQPVLCPELLHDGVPQGRGPHVGSVVRQPTPAMGSNLSTLKMPWGESADRLVNCWRHAAYLCPWLEEGWVEGGGGGGVQE